MAGDLLLTNIDEIDLDVLLACGGKLGDTIFHADRYAAVCWDTWGSRLERGLGGSRANDRAGLPPHFYISFSNRDYLLKPGRELQFARVIGSAVRPLSIVTTHPGLEEWSQKKQNSVLLDIFAEALKRANITLEVYAYDGEDLINRHTGEIHGSLSYMKKAKE